LQCNSHFRLTSHANTMMFISTQTRKQSSLSRWSIVYLLNLVY